MMSTVTMVKSLQEVVAFLSVKYGFNATEALACLKIEEPAAPKPRVKRCCAKKQACACGRNLNLWKPVMKELLKAKLPKRWAKEKVKAAKLAKKEAAKAAKLKAKAEAKALKDAEKAKLKEAKKAEREAAKLAKKEAAKAAKLAKKEEAKAAKLAEKAAAAERKAKAQSILDAVAAEESSLELEAEDADGAAASPAIAPMSPPKAPSTSGKSIADQIAALQLDDGSDSESDIDELSLSD